MYKKCEEILNKLESEGKIKISNYQFPPKQELKLKLKDILEDEVDEKYYLSEEIINKIRYKFDDENVLVGGMQKNQSIKKDGICTTLTSSMGTGGGYVPMVSRKYGVFDTEKTKHQAGSVYDKNGLSPTLDTMQGGWRQPCIEELGYVEKKYKGFLDEKGYIPDMFNPYNKSEIKDIAPTQSTQCGSTTSSATILIKEAYEGDEINISSRMKYQRGNVQKESIQTLTTSGGNDRAVVLKSKCKRLESLVEKTDFEEGKVLNMDLYNQTTNENISQCLTEPHHNSQRLFDGLRIRKLTPKECWRLMGFDDEDYEKAAKANSNTQLYKQAGNSIVVNVLMAIFKQLIKEDL